MSRLATILVAVLLAAGCTSTDDLDATPTRTPVPRWQTLDNVIDRDELRCGVDHELAPFGYAEADGTVSGFEIEFCAAIAAAVLRDASKVVYVLAEDRARHFDLLRDGSIDVLMPTTAVTATHDREWGADFAQPVFYTGQAFVVHVDSPFYSLSDLDEALICFHPTAANTDPFPWEGYGDVYNPLGGLRSDPVTSFFSGRCDAFSAEARYTPSLFAGRDDANQYRLLPGFLSPYPLAPAVRDYDSEWKDVVNWVVNGLIAAEEMGITQGNVAAMASNPPDAEVARLLGASYEGGEVATLGFDSIDAQFIRRAIAAVGNYGEIYERTIGDAIPRACTLNALAVDDAVDCPHSRGGILYALPYR